ncbi:conserved hypothetical protein [Talaromyces stipitatus ATCC 10500]|uniref:Condensation domain-containing protein n=1 Tax=Talaromyces stipitatus (strain ATCC 10500 / CBS 375.48 / QM 6759 / NRRL 1006) TaxID=441959 RepID=B8MPJ1_TALSN|nr:uncharacterized protein TSTA_106390 [Talaromyces stipitatus ATCC 10500]EED14430.1 conserved hypothetical protein [Talaromyces stipitatus ATCC 10500]
MAEKTMQPYSLLVHGTSTTTELLHEIASNNNINAESIEDIYPCTPLQIGLLSLTSRNPTDYVLHEILELNTTTSLDKFCAAWEEVYRTKPLFTPSFGLKETARNHRILETDSGQPLSRYAIIKGQPGKKSSFIWTIHHSLFDGWFLSLVVTRRVSELYLCHPCEQMIEFKTFVAHMLEKNNTEAEQYWASALQGFDSGHFLAPSSSRTRVQPENLRVEQHFGQARLQDHHHIRRSVLAYAAWAITMSIETKSGDVVFGGINSGRQADVYGIKQIAGPTISTVPIRVNVRLHKKVSDFLEEIERDAQDRVRFEYLGLSRIAKINSSTNRACEFQTLVVIQPTANDLYMDPAVGNWKPESKDLMATAYRLVIQMFFENNGTRLAADYNPNAIDGRTVHRLLAEFTLLMKQLAEADAGRRTMGDLELLSGDEQERLWLWNMNALSTIERCVHDLIEEQVQLRPDALAIQAWDGQLTYSELGGLATSLRISWSPKGSVPGQ